MNAPPALAALSSFLVAPVSSDDEMDLAALLDLFVPEDEDLAEAPTARPSLLSPGTALPAWAQKLSLRSAEWAARLGGPRRAW